MKKELITHKDPKSPISEVFKTLRTNLQFTNHNQNTLSLLVTSTMPREGKTWVTSNLGVTFAQSNKKVVIIDSDMRKGRLHNVFGTKIFPGFSNYLAETETSIKEYLIQTDIENLWMIPAGNVPPNPSELLSGKRIHEGLDELKQEFDVILFDSTPCMLVTDAVIISRIVDTTIIVSSYKLTKMENLKAVQKNIENVGGKIAGVVINKIPISLKKYKSKYYYYGDRSREASEQKQTREKTVEQNENENSQDKENAKKEAMMKIVEESKIKTPIVEDVNIQNQLNEDSEIIGQIDEYLEKNK